MRAKRRTKSMIGASAPDVCAGCGQKIVGEGWDMTWLLWKGEYVPRIRHAFRERCADLIRQRYRDALNQLEAA